VQHCKRLFEFIRLISWNHRCNYGLYSVVSHGVHTAGVYTWSWFWTTLFAK